MIYTIDTASIFEIGQRTDKHGRPHQEDCMYPAPENLTPADRLFIVCDGMGGHDAGEVASATVCEAMSRSILASCPNAEGDFTQADFDRALADAFAALDLRDTGAERKMGTTMTLLKLYDGGAFIAWMGDSRVYQLRPTADGPGCEVVYRTDDHSLVNDLVKIGELTEEEARTSPQRNIITRALQPHLTRKPRAGVKWIDDVRPGDFFYLCTDGMLEEATDADICRTFATAGSMEALVETLTADTAANHDNHSAIIVRIASVENAPLADENSEPRESEDAPGTVMVLDETTDEAEEEITDPNEPAPEKPEPKGDSPLTRLARLLGLIR